MESRTPDQVGNDIVLCKDGTLWKWSDFYATWVMLPAIPTDEQYAISLKDMEKVAQEYTTHIKKKSR
jgi:hypothetical protein